MIQSAARSAFSRGVSFGWGAAQRTHSNLPRLIPLAKAESGSNALLVSIKAQHSPRCVTSLIKERSRVVRPEEMGPQISLRYPRGIAIDPCFSSAIPTGMVSGAMTDLIVKAPGMRLAREASICVRSDDAAELTETPFRPALYSPFIRLQEYDSCYPKPACQGGPRGGVSVDPE